MEYLEMTVKLNSVTRHTEVARLARVNGDLVEMRSPQPQSPRARGSLGSTGRKPKFPSSESTQPFPSPVNSQRVREPKMRHALQALCVLLVAGAVQGAPRYHYKYVIGDILIRGVPTRNAFGTMSYLLGNLTSGEAAVSPRLIFLSKCKPVLKRGLRVSNDRPGDR